MMSQLESTHLHQEIYEQPSVIRRLVTGNADALSRIQQAYSERDIAHVVIAARGSSDNAGRYAKYLFGAHNRLVVSLATPSLFTIYQSPPNLAKALVLGISQSGQSPDVSQVVETARRQGGVTIAICNDADSTLAKSAEFMLDIQAGPELSIAATKTYTGQLTLIAMLSKVLAGQDPAEDLSPLPDAVEAALATYSIVEELAAHFWSIRHIAVIGRGFNYATSYEIALKLKEMTYTMAAPYSSADFIHGPLALIEPGFPIILIAPSGKIKSQLLSFIQTTRDLGAKLIVISDDDEMLSLSDHPIALNVSVPEWLSPIVTIIPGQLLGMHLAHLRGIHPDTPRTIRKITRTI